MKPFTLTLDNRAKLTGLTNLPALLETAPKHVPLIVGLHGGSYSSSYFDADTKHTASLASNGLGIPFVAIDRPGYQGSTSFYPIPEGSSFPETSADWLHRFILPAVWKEFGLPRGCNSMVLLCHSLGVPGALIAAANLDQTPVDEPASYPLAGIIMSGFGTQPIQDARPPLGVGAQSSEFMEFSPKVKDAIVMPEGTCDPALYAETARLNKLFPSREVDDIWVAWLPRWKTEWTTRVRVPVMIGIAERDGFWKGTEEHVLELKETFSGSSRVEGGVIKGAPHNLEMSYWSQGWYARCFGFGMECAASFAASNWR
ncbi:Alpha/Beta hydrolase protein [Apodospora peruviana]|uniref:Alpha/Beta hydrolase protein n=1 Tax=Apodospora peruviana TaxID=516989 RepID=A0AAE0IAW4_9PEZI|nr:Alpha/Beta hydrolase protein [Apodospora peruviana]